MYIYVVVVECMLCQKRLEHGCAIDKTWGKGSPNDANAVRRTSLPFSFSLAAVCLSHTVSSSFLSLGEMLGAATHIWAPGTAILTRLS